MRRLQRRVERLERRSVGFTGEELLLVVERMQPARMTAEEKIDVTELGWPLGKETVLEILRKAGHIRADGCMRVVRNTDIPRGLGNHNPERWLREHGAEVVRPRDI